MKICNMSGSTSKVLEEALRAGGKMHAFLSGGGLRVICIEKAGELVAYGEHPHVDEALRIAADDYIAGGRDYGSVYNSKTETHYLTGDPKPDSELDAWVRQGSTFDAHVEGDRFIFELHGLHMWKTPEDIVKRAFAGETVRHVTERGVVCLTTPQRWPNGETGCSTQFVELPHGMPHFRASCWDVCKRGEGASLPEAVVRAFAAPEVEEPDERAK